MMVSLLLALQEHAAAAEGGINLPAPFQPTIGLAIWTFVVFISLLVLLAKTAFPVILKMTVDREEAIKKQLADAARLRDESAAALEEQRQLLAGARGEAVAILGEARQAAERERTLGLEKTRAEQEDLLARARQEIAAERDRAMAELRRETVDLAVAAASRVVGQSLDSAADRRIVEEYLAGIGKNA